MALFEFRRRRADDEDKQRVAAWARAAWEARAGMASEGTLVKANEIVCADPACPGVETVILVMEPGQKARAFKIAMPIAQVAQDDVVAMLQFGN